MTKLDSISPFYKWLFLIKVGLYETASIISVKSQKNNSK